MSKIVYQTETGIAIIHPTPEALESITIEEIAKKDVPTGVPYWIVDDSEIPEDRIFRNSWYFEADREADGVGD